MDIHFPIHDLRYRMGDHRRTVGIDNPELTLSTSEHAYNMRQTFHEANTFKFMNKS